MTSPRMTMTAPKKPMVPSTAHRMTMTLLVKPQIIPKKKGK